MQKTVIIDYGSGNLRSAAKAFEHASVEEVQVTNDPAALKDASHIVLPGVGAYADCKAGLEAVPGMIEALEDEVINQQKPFLGICVGMQLMATRGREHGETAGFDWIKGEVVEIEPTDVTLKIPHMGWNEVNIESDHPVLSGVPNNSHFYFVHSYFAEPIDKNIIAATTTYGIEFCSAVAFENVVAVQFHPEKSGSVGLKIYENFVQFTRMSTGGLS